MIGFFAYSLAGHDKEKMYMIIKEEKDYVWLVDGNIRTLDNPKKKNKKHIQIIKNKNAGDILYSVTDETVKRAIKLYSKDI